MKNFNSFTRLYPVSKTLRFELKPIGKTLEHIEQNGLLEQDKHRAESYQKVKELIDDYHKDFINKTLFEFSQKDTLMSKFDGMLEEFFILYQIKNKEDAQKKEFEEKQNKLRKMIVGFIKSDSRFSRIDKKELIKEDLLKFLANDENAALVNEFREFTTYFTGFHENRMNMYSEEAQSTAIAYRLIHENLPKFIDNMQTFLYVAASPVAEKFSEIYRSFEPYLNVSSIEEIFQLNYYKLVLTQTQIDVYNALIGGKTEEDGTKIQGLNEYINLFNQQQTDKHNRLPKFKTLFKQILSDRNRISWLPDAFSSDREVLASIEENYQRLQTTVFQSNEVSHSLKELMISLRDYDLERIWIKNDIQLTEISQKMFGNWNVIEKAIVEALKEKVKRNKKDTDETYLERRLKVYKSIDSFSIEEINHSLEKVGYNQRVEDYFANLGAVDTADKQTESLTAQITNAYTEVKTLLTTPYPEGKNLSQDKENAAKIKTLLDSFKALQHFVKPLLGKGDEAEKDGRFYGDFTALWDELGHITPIYNMVRNYLTRKPYSTEKIKLNFENSTLLNGWDLNKETDNSGVLLRKDGMYYLAIMAKGWNKVFTGALPDHGQCYEKIDYKLLPGPNKMLPKVFFSKSRMAEFSPSESLLEHYEQGTHKKGPQFNLSHCHELIDFFKSSIQKHSDWCQFGFQFSDTATYNDLNGFYQEVESQGYKISFRNVSVDYIDTLVDDGKLYLFQIYNKDFSTFSKGTPNMHTLYWKMLFDERNLKDVVYKLNGQAEVFYRKSSIVANAPTHPANKPIANKNPDNAKKESLFYYNLIKDRRYTIDKFMFHVPITMNFKAIGRDNINTQVNDFIRQTDDLHIIGIDRGERHLLYLCVIDMKGNIVEQYSLNDIVNEYNHNRYSTNYHELLERREGERTEARRSWKTIESIKELKEGYLSQVIHKIADLMVKYQAIVVLEDLNLGFKRGRQKVESSVYQQFEKQLIDKLNYLVDKKKAADETGGVLQALQLTNHFESFQKLGKQSGFLFYIPAWNTSKMDPVTGFVNLFDTHYENIEKTRLFFSRFESIRYNTEKGWFEFKFDYSNKFTERAEGTRTLWTLCTQGTRVETFRNPGKNGSWDSVEINLTERFKGFLKEYGIDIHANLAEQTEKAFYEGLLYLFRLTLQMRNSVTGTEIDYLISPVANETGDFFDSRTCGERLPANADANGAYNIARKGLWAVLQIKASADEKVRLAISNKEWLKFAQEKPYLRD